MRPKGPVSRESEQPFEAAFNQYSIALAHVDSALRFLHVNPALCRLFGRSAEDLACMHLCDLLESSEGGRTCTEMDAFAERQLETLTLIAKGRRDSGGPFDAKLRLTWVGSPDAPGSFVLVVIMDVTEELEADSSIRRAHQEAESLRLRAEEAVEQYEILLLQAEQIAITLEQRELALRTLVSSISSILIGIDARGRVGEWNPAASRTFGIRLEDAAGQLLTSLGLSWHEPEILAAIALCKADLQIVRVEDVSFSTIEGKGGFLGVTVHPLILPGGAIEGVLILAADISERRILERQLVTAQKLESLGQLTAGIAHEINTPTQFVSDNVRYVRDAAKKMELLLQEYRAYALGALDGAVDRTLTEELNAKWEILKMDKALRNVPEALDESLEGLKRITTIVRAMKDFSHPGTERKTLVDLNACVTSTTSVARNEWKYVAEIEFDLAADLPLVPCIASQINQVILNLVVNAAHAIGDAQQGSQTLGRITVTTEFSDDWVMIGIRDTGVGIPEAVRDRIFDPFFTTKEVGRGTGQGLALVHSVVTVVHGGRIDVSTEVGVGTCMTIKLPRADEMSEAA